MEVQQINKKFGYMRSPYDWFASERVFFFSKCEASQFVLRPRQMNLSWLLWFKLLRRACK